MASESPLEGPRGSRDTRQRKAILAVLRRTKCHPTAEWVHQEVRKQLPRISLGTVYRNLKVLRDMGQIAELVYGPALSHFDGTPEEHCHVRCLHCHKIDDLPLDPLAELKERAKKATSFVIDRVRLEFEGLCPLCQRKAKRSSGRRGL